MRNTKEFLEKYTVKIVIKIDKVGINYRLL